MKINVKQTILMVAATLLHAVAAIAQIDRESLVRRNNPIVSSMDTLSSLTVGNGSFAYTVDATGMQSFPEYYRGGVCLGTMSEWGWHSFPNADELRPEEALRAYDFGHHSDHELYSTQTKTPGRAHDASEYFRINPHRLHLGALGFAFNQSVKPADVKDIHQKLDMWTGRISSRFTVGGHRYEVETACHGSQDIVGVHIVSKAHTPLCLRLPYPSGGHVDDGCDWTNADRHTSCIEEQGEGYAVVRHDIDTAHYYIRLGWEQPARFAENSAHRFELTPLTDTLSVTCWFMDGTVRQWVDMKEGTILGGCIISYEADIARVMRSSESFWKKRWQSGGAVDFSACTDPRAAELERRVVLSQYLITVQEGGWRSNPPQETGLTMNSWFGKFHLEMLPWHMAWMPLWSKPSGLENAMRFYMKKGTRRMAQEIAARQGFDGERWMKMTDPWAGEAPSNVGSFLIWQQPHPIYLSELIHRYNAATGRRQKYSEQRRAEVIDATARFMYSFANRDSLTGRYNLRHYIPAQESLKASVTYNSPLELSQWHCTMQIAQQWRERSGQPRSAQWDDLIHNLSPLASNADSLYLAAESAPETFSDLKATSDHPAMLGALGFYPESPLIDKAVMSRTLDWVIRHWHWDTAWGWDFPMAAMTATRLNRPDTAIDCLLMPAQKNTYLNNGHNYQDKRLRIYLPGNGGLLSAIALMCAGWDGCTTPTPGFPKDGHWNVKWEGLLPLP